jgi:hypothetical protein
MDQAVCPVLPISCIDRSGQVSSRVELPSNYPSTVRVPPSACACNSLSSAKPIDVGNRPLCTRGRVKQAALQGLLLVPSPHRGLRGVRRGPCEHPAPWESSRALLLFMRCLAGEFGSLLSCVFPALLASSRSVGMALSPLLRVVRAVVVRIPFHLAYSICAVHWEWEWRRTTKRGWRLFPYVWERQRWVCPQVFVLGHGILRGIQPDTSLRLKIALPL